LAPIPAVLDSSLTSMLGSPRFLIVLFIAQVVTSAAARRSPRNPASPGSAEPPNIILVTLDTTRADRVGFLGSTGNLTPNLDTLAKESVVFTRAYAQVPLTGPSHAALLTGTYPQFSHVKDVGDTLERTIPYMPEVLRKHGYHTAAFLGASILDRGMAPGLDRGFEVYDAPFHARRPGEDRYHSLERRAEDVANGALSWLSRRPSGPFFLWLHFYDPHDPYDPPEPFKTRYAKAPYDGEIAYVDSVLGEFFAMLQRHRLFENSVIAIAADHGEAFGEHGEMRHGMFLYDETVHVPFLMRLPSGSFAGMRVEVPVALVDLAPSLLQAAGIVPPAEMQGKSLLPLFGRQKNASVNSGKQGRVVFSETNYTHRTFGWAELHSLREGKYLYIRSPKRELYDQASDPGAVNNLELTASAVADTLDSQLLDFLQKTSSLESAHPRLDPAQAEKLRALGYANSDSTSASTNEKVAVDPRDKITVANKFFRALVDTEEDRYDEAISELRDVVRMEPNLSAAYLELGTALVHQRDYDDALRVLRKAATQMPDSGLLHYELGFALVKTGQWEAALSEMQAAVACTPTSAQMHFYLGAILLRLKRVQDATAEFDKVLALDADHFMANLKYGEVLLLQGNATAALPKLSQALKANPESAEAHAFLAEAYDKLGQVQNAEEERTRASQLKSQPPE